MFWKVKRGEHERKTQIWKIKERRWKEGNGDGHGEKEKEYNGKARGEKKYEREYERKKWGREYFLESPLPGMATTTGSHK